MDLMQPKTDAWISVKIDVVYCAVHRIFRERERYGTFFTVILYKRANTTLLHVKGQAHLFQSSYNYILDTKSI